MTNEEFRRDYYTNCLTISFEGEMISKDTATTYAMRYLVEGNTEKYEYLKKEIVRVKAEAKAMFPEE